MQLKRRTAAEGCSVREGKAYHIQGTVRYMHNRGARGLSEGSDRHIETSHEALNEWQMENI